MSWLSSVQNFFFVTEANVLAVVAKIKKAEQVAAHEIGIIINWILDNAPTITADIEQILSIVQIVGVANPAVEAGVTAAHEAIAVLDAAVAAHKSGAGTAATALAAYGAFKAAQGTVANAAAVAVAAPVKAAA